MFIDNKAPINKANEPPKQIPGIRTGKSTPKDMPTNPLLRARMYKKTMATSDPTGTNKGSRKVYVKKEQNTAVTNPEKNRCFL